MVKGRMQVYIRHCDWNHICMNKDLKIFVCVCKETEGLTYSLTEYLEQPWEISSMIMNHFFFFFFYTRGMEIQEDK